MKRGILLMLVGVLSLPIFGQTATIEGTVTEKESGEVVLFANVVLLQDGAVVTGASTDFDGNFRISGIEAGVYDIRLNYIGLREFLLTGLEIVAGEAIKINPQLEAEYWDCCCLPIYVPSPPLIDQEDMYLGMTFKLDKRGRVIR
ncbi:MAG: carboxypeptidase regulatory-like domain-containing protein [Saprospiraceae bacterium]|nr:carboxypeptidase regulatory-like domain-containing protein [Saprospiraceae bacterium]